MSTHTLQARKWYRTATGPGSSALIAPIEKTGSTVQGIDLSGGGLGLTAPSAQWFCIYDDGHTSTRSDKDLGALGIGGLEGPLDDRPDLTDADIDTLKAAHAETLKAAQQEAARQAEEDAKERDTLPAQFKHLTPSASMTSKRGEVSRWAAGSKNLKKDLEHAFPGLKVKSTSECYSGGCSINARWTDGPIAGNEGPAKEIASRYQTSGFDGMQDLKYSVKSNHADVFGGACYVFINRDMSDNTRGLLEAWAAERFAAGDDWGAIDAGNLAHRLFCATELPPGAVVTGVVPREERDTGPGYGVASGWRVTYDAPKTAPKPAQARTARPRPVDAARKPSAPVSDVVQVTEHTHTKKGFQMWIVEIGGRVAKDRFKELMAEAREGRGWYSRAWAGTPGGFAFKQQDAAQTFAASL